MRHVISLGLVLIMIAVVIGCNDEEESPPIATPTATAEPTALITPTAEPTATITDEILHQTYPHIAGYVKDGKDLLQIQESNYDIVYSSNIDEDTAQELKQRNQDIIILYQGPVNYMFDSAILIIEATTGKEITDEFWLKDVEGDRCGWGMNEIGLPELWAVDITKDENIETMASFYANILEYQPQYEGLFFDVIEEFSRCDSVADSQWVSQTTMLLKAVREKIGDKIILTNSGFNYKTNTPYLQYLNGYAMESFLSGAAGFDEGLETVDLVLEKTLNPHILVYTHYGENTVTKETVPISNMRLALCLSLLNDNTYLHYDSKMEDIGNVMWQPEFGARLGQPLGEYYEKDNAYFRDFENGVVVCVPHTDIEVIFDVEMTDITTDTTSTTFNIAEGDGRIYIVE